MNEGHNLWEREGGRDGNGGDKRGARRDEEEEEKE